MSKYIVIINKILRAAYLAIISLVLISIVVTLWTSYVLVSQPSKSSEITKVIKDIYHSQKSLVIDVIDLTKILRQDNSKDLSAQSNTFQVEEQSVFDKSQKSNSNKEISIIDNEGNPSEIVIEPSEEKQNLDNEEIGVPIQGLLSSPENENNLPGIVIEPSEVDKG